MVIFNSYVKLPEGNSGVQGFDPDPLNGGHSLVDLDMEEAAQSGYHGTGNFSNDTPKNDALPMETKNPGF